MSFKYLSLFNKKNNLIYNTSKKIIHDVIILENNICEQQTTFEGDFQSNHHSIEEIFLNLGKTILINDSLT